jgi:hypothetical protein
VFVAFAVLAFPLAIVLWARHFWAVLASEAPLANERHLLLAITLSAVLALPSICWPAAPPRRPARCSRACFPR